jgi:hypothetical protein
LNILFVMKHRGNAGNTHAVANYIRVGPRYGHNIALFGQPQPHLPELKFSTRVRDFDRIAFLFESEIYRLSRLHEATMLGSIPRERRLIFDMDGMYNPVVCVDGYDFNHRTGAESAMWAEYYEALADRVMKPTLSRQDRPGVEPMIFYGYDPALEMNAAAAPEKRFDIIYVGHNWWRWRQIEREFLPAVEAMRGEIGEIGLIGLWWDKPPAEGADAGPEAAFHADYARIRRLGIKTETAVMYTDVIRTMSTAKINIFNQRPVLHHLKHLTLKYFEIFYADTIPLLMLDRGLVAQVYGPAADALVLAGEPRETEAKLRDALARPDHYRRVVGEVRKYLAENYSYDKRVAELAHAFRH